MKPKISLKGMLISLATAILSVGILNYAAGDITFPNNFQNGTVADADQVNANFAAINTRQAATLAKLAGTYDYRGSGIFLENQANCPVSFGGTIVLNSTGSGTVSETDNDECQGTVSGTNSVTVKISSDGSSNGSGTLTFGNGGGANSIQVSKDLNTIIISSTTSGIYTSSVAVRR